MFALVCQAIGDEEARQKIGVNATGLPFNSVMAIELNQDRTLNPMVDVRGQRVSKYLSERMGLNLFASKPHQ